MNIADLTEEQLAMLTSALEEANRTNTENTESIENVAPVINDIPNVYLEDDLTSRFNSAVWLDKIKEQTVTLAGLGGIGSWLALLLARLNVTSLYLYDPDIVERVNLGGQLYGNDSVGSHKTSAIQSIIRKYAEYYCSYSYSRPFEEGSVGTYIMMCGFDNMKARKTFYKVWKKFWELRNEENKKKCLFIDARMAAEQFQIFCIKGDNEVNMAKYEKEWLFSDEEAEETVCSYKQTSFCANLVAGYMTNLFVNFAANEAGDFIPRPLPFFTSYDCRLMRFNIEMQ